MNLPLVSQFVKALSAVILALPICAAAQSLGEIVNSASKDLGKVVAVHQGSRGSVVLLEEEHTSRAGQIEIANILVRLYKRQGMRIVGLEGSTDSKLDAKWAVRMPPTDRFRVASRLLGDGELSSAEFLASAFADVKVIGIDSPVDYKVDMQDRASVASVLYLVLIAQTSLNPAAQEKLGKLLEQKKIKEATEFSINSDSWTKRVYATLTDRSRNPSIEVELDKISSIEAEAKKRSVPIPPQLSQDLEELKAFLQAASRRSDYMVTQIARLATDPKQVVAAIIGAGHTERMTKLLKAQGIAHAIVRPNALDQRSEGTVRSDEYQAYKRKLEGKSVDTRGLGAILDRQRKPPPVVAQPWLERKASIYQATLAVVDRVLIAAVQPPYQIESLPPGYRVDTSKLSRVGDEIIFPIEFDVGGAKQTVWVRAAYSRNTVAASRDGKSIDERIERLLKDAGGRGGDGNGGKPPGPPSKDAAGDRPGGKKPEGSAKKPNPDAKQLAEGTYALFASDRQAVEKQAVLSVSTI